MWLPLRAAPWAMGGVAGGGLASGMANLQMTNAERLSQLREDRSLKAVQRLAAERAAREPDDWQMEDASRVGSASSRSGAIAKSSGSTVANT